MNLFLSLLYVCMVNIKLNIILWQRQVILSSQNINAKLSIRKLGSSSVLIIIIIIINNIIIIIIIISSNNYSLL